jgi:hypothetical protein
MSHLCASREEKENTAGFVKEFSAVSAFLICGLDRNSSNALILKIFQDSRFFVTLS